MPYGKPDPEPWPFGDDARRDDPLTQHRIAVTCSHPRWAYLVAFDAASEARPTDKEVAMLASFLEQYKDYWYRPGHREHMERRLLDVDGHANGVIFHKWGEDDWGFRKQSFVYGNPFTVLPPHMRDGSYKGVQGPLALEAVMDWIHAHGGTPDSCEPSPRWREWKAAHPEVFGS